MKLYHGSTVDIPHVDLAKSKPNKDFGRAFYLSDDEQQALELAQFRAEFEETTPIVNVYEFDEALFEKFQIKRFEAYTEEWHTSSMTIEQSPTAGLYMIMTSCMAR